MISPEEVKKIASLCKIRINESQVSSMTSELSEILDTVDQLKEVNTENVEPLTCVLSGDLYTRKDDVSQDCPVEHLFLNVPGSNQGLAREVKCYVVPKMVK